MKSRRLSKPNLLGISSTEIEAVIAMLAMLVEQDDAGIVGGTVREMVWQDPMDAGHATEECEKLVRRGVFIRQVGKEFDPNNRGRRGDPRAWYCFAPSLFVQGSDRSALYRRELMEHAEHYMGHELKLKLLTEGALRVCFPVADGWS